MSRPEPPYPTADDMVTARMREACQEIIDREAEEASDMTDPNCYGAGYSAGAIAAAKELLACLDEECQ